MYRLRVFLENDTCLENLPGKVHLSEVNTHPLYINPDNKKYTAGG